MNTTKQPILIIVLSLLLVAAIAIVTPAQVFAAGTNKYIKDLKMVFAADTAAANSKIGSDYKLITTPIYKGVSGNTYVAYCTTNDPTEAMHKKWKLFYL